jgi:hypothetical protein
MEEYFADERERVPGGSGGPAVKTLEYKEMEPFVARHSDAP